MPDKSNSLDVAYLAGVSQSTVSRALRGSPSVSEATRLRIEAIARKLNYAVDRNASSLRTQQSNTIALLFFADPTSDDSLINPFFLAMLGSITRACSRRGYDLLISFQELSGNWLGAYGDSKKADGLILLGYGDYLEYRDRLEELVARGTHFVRWGAVSSEQPGISVGCDNFQGGVLAAEHLLRLQRRHPAFLGNASDHYPEFFDRYRGYASAWAARGTRTVDVLKEEAINTEASGYDAACRLLARNAQVDAIFAASDMIALGAMHALRDHRRHVPTEISIVGFDDIPAARLGNPPLTTVLQDTRRAGDALVDTLLALVNGNSVANVLLPASLVVRQSCGAQQYDLSDAVNAT